MAWAGTATSDRQLARLFTRRSMVEPAHVSSVGILSTYPPTQCGIATFAASLTAALVAGTPNMSVGIVRVRPVPHSHYDPLVVLEVSGNTLSDSREAANALNRFDVVIIQHEYGIYDGTDGDQILDILEWLRVPVLLVAHTVLSQPSAHQRYVLETLMRSAAAVVTMSEAGRRRLLDNYLAEPGKIVLIPHGASVSSEARSMDEPVQAPAPGRRPMVLTWGLLGPGKGIEWGIDALAEMGLLRPRPRYVIAGQTHPQVLEAQGESYRESLMQRAESRGVSHLVEFEPGFINPERLRELQREADVVLLPYDSHEQITSGVLVEAMASPLPVVSTAFPHAVELLSDGLGGSVVPHGQPEAIAAALMRILVDRGVAAAMTAHNAALTEVVNWPAIAGRYRQLLNAMVRQPSASRE